MCPRAFYQRNGSSFNCTVRYLLGIRETGSISVTGCVVVLIKIRSGCPKIFTKRNVGETNFRPDLVMPDRETSCAPEKKTKSNDIDFIGRRLVVRFVATTSWDFA